MISGLAGFSGILLMIAASEIQKGNNTPGLLAGLLAAFIFLNALHKETKLKK